MVFVVIVGVTSWLMNVLLDDCSRRVLSFDLVRN